MTFSRPYFLAFLAVLAIEIVIALFVRDTFVRPFVGDVLAVILVYCLARAFVAIPYLHAVSAALAVACAVELAQLFQLGARLSIPPRSALGIVLGSHFDPNDLLAYLCGALIVVRVERARRLEVRPFSTDDRAGQRFPGRFARRRNGGPPFEERETAREALDKRGPPKKGET